MPKFSIIVPVFKVEKYLNRCVDSILAQKFTDFECILVDDGSPDKCPEICDDYAKRDKRIKVIHQKNSGVSAARNTGLDAAEGEWIGFIDSDDWVENNYLEVLTNLKNADEYDLIQFNFVTRNVEKKVFSYECIENGEIDLNQNYTCPWWFGMCWSRFYKKSFLLENKIKFPVNITYSEDTYFSFIAIANANRIFGLREKIYNYCLRDSSVIQNLNYNTVISRCKALEMISKDIPVDKLNYFPIKKEMLECKYWFLRKGYFETYRQQFKEWNNFPGKTFKMKVLGFLAELHFDFLGKLLSRL